ncbi:hypothetical protein B0H16DRAFT_1722964 [Mycena metata]|uniref:Zn(2)-C6 fungal-type domain-containing protein n=1 Tax=Mycena metata TaxID=1033252 RepID=A0AAD7NBH5_9AGAR|nr:hypothetical protein B0H16DRAFT_1722964 [Mycena metata]
MNSKQDTNDLMRRFWFRVGDLCARSRISSGWVGTEELRKWNKENCSPCGKCLLSKVHKVCDIMDDHPSCLTCRNKKIRCDRRARFVYEHTKDEFFSDFEEFMIAFNRAPPKDVREIKKHKSRTRKMAMEALNGSNNGSCSDAAPTMAVALCAGCIQDFERGKKAGKKKRIHASTSGRPLHALTPVSNFEALLQHLKAARTQIQSMRCELKHILATAGEPDSSIDQLVSIADYYESAISEHQRYL